MTFFSVLVHIFVQFIISVSLSLHFSFLEILKLEKLSYYIF